MVFKAASPELGKRLFYNRKQGGLPAWLRKHGCSGERVPSACSRAVDGIRFSFPHQWEKEGCKACNGVRYLAGFPFFLLGLPVLDGFRNGGIPVFHMEVIGCLAVIVAERGIGAVIHEANGYFRRVAGHQRSQAIHVRLVGIRSCVDEKFNERNEAFRRFFLGADQVEG